MAVVNEPSVFEPLKFYCIDIRLQSAAPLLALWYVFRIRKGKEKKMTAKTGSAEDKFWSLQQSG